MSTAIGVVSLIWFAFTFFGMLIIKDNDMSLDLALVSACCLIAAAICFK